MAIQIRELVIKAEIAPETPESQSRPVEPVPEPRRSASYEGSDRDPFRSGNNKNRER